MTTERTSAAGWTTRGSAAPLGWTRTTPAVLGFAARRQLLLILTVVAALSVAGRASWSSPGFGTTWARVDPVLALATLAAALMVWLSEARQDWERSLPRQITVEFWTKQDGVIMRCERAPLLDDAPRAWAQQLGRQMSNNAELEFYPIPDAEPARPERWQGRWVQHRLVRFELRTVPVTLSGTRLPLLWSPSNDFGRDVAHPSAG